MFLIPSHWSKHQHYKERFPPWIKLHRSLLDNIDFYALPDNSKVLLFQLWLIASEDKQGIIKADSTMLAFRLHSDSTKIATALSPLIYSGFMLASDTIADCLQLAVSEQRRDISEREKNKPVDKFENQTQEPNPLADRITKLGEKMRVAK